MIQSPTRFLTTTSAPPLVVITILLVISFLVTVNGHPAISQTSAATATAEGPVNAIRTADGFLLVWNRPDIHLTVLIRGKDIKPLNDAEHVFFDVDGMVFQIQLAGINEFAPEAREQKLDDRTILAAHREWESKFIEGLLGNQLKLQSFNAKLSNNMEASLWQFDMPEGANATAKKQLYLSVVRGDYVVLLNSVATVNISEETARKFLLDTMATLKISPTPIDVKKLSETIRKGAGV